MKRTLAITGIASLTMLTGCGSLGPGGEREASMARCERQFGQMAPDPDKGEAFCGCLIDRLAEQGLEITDMLGDDAETVMQTTRSCASAHGVPIAG